MNEPDWTSDVRQEEWSLEMIFQWLEETAAFLYQIRQNSRSADERRAPHLSEGARCTSLKLIAPAADARLSFAVFNSPFSIQHSPLSYSATGGV
jgi:hypothetical protein